MPMQVRKAHFHSPRPAWNWVSEMTRMGPNWALSIPGVDRMSELTAERTWLKLEPANAILSVADMEKLGLVTRTGYFLTVHFSRQYVTFGTKWPAVLIAQITAAGYWKKPMASGFDDKSTHTFQMTGFLKEIERMPLVERISEMSDAKMREKRPIENYGSDERPDWHFAPVPKKKQRAVNPMYAAASLFSGLLQEKYPEVPWECLEEDPYGFLIPSHIKLTKSDERAIAEYNEKNLRCPIRSKSALDNALG